MNVFLILKTKNVSRFILTLSSITSPCQLLTPPNYKTHIKHQATKPLYLLPAITLRRVYRVYYIEADRFAVACQKIGLWSLRQSSWAPDPHLMTNVPWQQNFYKQNQQLQHHVSSNKILRSVCNVGETNNAL